jgi:hypothetical protein
MARSLMLGGPRMKTLKLYAGFSAATGGLKRVASAILNVLGLRQKVASVEPEPTSLGRIMIASQPQARLTVVSRRQALITIESE